MIPAVARGNIGILERTKATSMAVRDRVRRGHTGERIHKFVEAFPVPDSPLTSRLLIEETT